MTKPRSWREIEEDEAFQSLDPDRKLQVLDRWSQRARDFGVASGATADDAGLVKLQSFRDQKAQQFEALKAPQEPESSNIFRRALDVPTSALGGVITGLKGVSDAFGANNPVSQELAEYQQFYNEALSPEGKAAQRKVADIMKEAEDGSLMEQIGAGVQAFATAPLETTSQALGTMAPTIATGVAGKALQLGARGVQVLQGAVGAAMQAGIVKSQIYDGTKNLLLESGKTEEEADQIASEAQSYGGKNLDQILLAAGLGVAGATTGVERILGGAFNKGAAASGVIRNTLKTGAVEAIPESIQAGQEQVATNIAAQREGFDVPTMRGVVPNAVMEGIAGFVGGAPAGTVEALATSEKIKEDAPLTSEALRKKGLQAVSDTQAEIIKETTAAEEDAATLEILDDMEAKAAAENPPAITATDPEIPIEDRIKTAMDELQEAGRRFDRGEITNTQLGQAAQRLDNLRAQQRNVARGEGTNPLQQYVDKTKVNSNDILDLLSEYGDIDAQTLADVQNPEAAVAWLARNNIGVPGQPWRGRTLTPFGDQGAGTPLFDQAPKEPTAPPVTDTAPPPAAPTAATPTPAPTTPPVAGTTPPPTPEPVVEDTPPPAPRTLDQFTDDELDQESTILERQAENETDPVRIEEINTQIQAVAAERQRRTAPSAPAVVDATPPLASTAPAPASSAPEVTNTPAPEDTFTLTGEPAPLAPRQQQPQAPKPVVADSGDQGQLPLGSGAQDTNREVNIAPPEPTGEAPAPGSLGAYRQELANEARQARRLSPTRDLDQVADELADKPWLPARFRSKVMRRKFARQLLDEAREARSAELGVGNKTVVPGSRTETSVYDDSLSSGQVPSARTIFNRLSKEAGIGKKTGNLKKDAEREAKLVPIRQQAREVEAEANRLVAANLGIPNPESVVFAPDFTGKNTLPQRSVTAKDGVTRLENIFVNDANITARQLDRGMEITIPKDQRSSVDSNITYNRRTGRVTSAVSGETVVSGPDQLQRVKKKRTKELSSSFTIPEESKERQEKLITIVQEFDNKTQSDYRNITRQVEAANIKLPAEFGPRVKAIALQIAGETLGQGKKITASTALKQSYRKVWERMKVRPELMEMSLDMGVDPNDDTTWIDIAETTDDTADTGRTTGGKKGEKVVVRNPRSDISRLVGRMTNTQAQNVLSATNQKLEFGETLSSAERQAFEAAREFTLFRDKLQSEGKLDRIPAKEREELTYADLQEIGGVETQLPGTELPPGAFASAESRVTGEPVEVSEAEINEAKSLVEEAVEGFPAINELIETDIQGYNMYVLGNDPRTVYVNLKGIAQSVQGVDRDTALAYIKKILNHETRHMALLRAMPVSEITAIGEGMTQAQLREAAESYHAKSEFATEAEREAAIKAFMENPTLAAMEYVTILSERLQSGSSIQDLGIEDMPLTFLERIVEALRAILNQLRTRMMLRAPGYEALAIGVERLEEGIRLLEEDLTLGDRIAAANEGGVFAAAEGIVTPQQDAEYLAAVERGDMETAQRMVDEAAQRAGYNPEKWYHHGTAVDQFSIPSPINNKQFVWFAKDKKYAERIGKRTLLGEKKRATLTVSAYLAANNFLDARSLESYDQTKQTILKFFEDNGITGLTRADLDISNLGGGEPFYTVLARDQGVIKNAIQKAGYDSVLLKEDFTKTDGSRIETEAVAVFTPDQIKASYAVTRDDRGNVIPLSARFNTETDLIFYAAEGPLGVDDNGFLRPATDTQGRRAYRVTINGVKVETTAKDPQIAARNAVFKMFDRAKQVFFEGQTYTSPKALIGAITASGRRVYKNDWGRKFAKPAVRRIPDGTPILPATKSEQAELPLIFPSMANPAMRVRVGQVNPEGRPKGGFWDRLKLMVRGRFSETKKRTGGVSGSGAATPMERDAILAQQARIKGTIVKAESMVKNYRRERKKHKDFTDEQINAALGTTENPFTDAQVKELNKIKDAKARDAKREEFRKANANTDRLVRLQALSQLPGFNPKFDGETEFHTGLAKAVEDMRVAIDEMSRALMSGDYIPADLKPRVEQNLNVYVHRSYTIFDNPEWKRFMLEPQTDEHRRIQSGAARLFQKYAVAEIAQELRAEAEKAGAPMSQRDAIRLASRERERIATRAGNMLVDYLSIADDKSNNFFITGELPGQRKLDIIKVRGQIPKEVRELWGEIQKADDNFLKTMSKMAGYMSATDTARELVRIGLEQKYMWKEGVSEGERPAGFHLIYRKGDASPLSVSPMDGVYAPAEVGEFMRSFRDHKTMYGWARQLAFMTAGTMAMKTIGNFPQGYVRNFFGNPFIMVNGGYINPAHPAEMFKAAKKAFKLALTSSGLRNNEAVVKSVSELTSAGLIGEGVDSGLMREMTDTGLGDLTWDKLYEAGAYETAMKRAARQATGTTRNTFEFFARIYQGVDDFWKVFAYEMEKFYQRKTHPDWTEAQISKEAIDRVRNKVPTYSLSPELTRNIRNIPFIAPFITWTSETIRTSANNLAIAAEDIRVGKETKNPEMVRNGYRAIRGFAFALGAFPTLAMISKAMFGYDDEDEDAYREGLPEWEQNASLVFLGKAADGTGRHWNASFLDPYQSRMEGPIAFLRAMRRGDEFTDALVQGGMETLRPLLSEQLLFGAITSILRNRTAQGKPIYNEQDTAFNKTRDTMGYLALAAGPGTIVGAGRRLYLASQGTVLPTGQTYDVGNELLGMFGGQKVSSIDFRTTLNRAKNRYASSKAEATQLFSQVFSSQGTVDLEDIGPAYENAARAHRELQEEMMRAFDNAIRMGVPRKDAIRILRGGMGGAEVSKDDLRAILSGKPRRWTPSEVSLDSAKEGKIPDGRARLKALRDYMRSVKGAGDQ